MEINTLDSVPIYEQVRNQIVLAIASGEISPGFVLPSVRKLAASLGINFHTVNKSYALLVSEGYIHMDRRKGAIVADNSENKDTFKNNLTKKLHISAAESHCHNISLEEYISLCIAMYKKAGGK